MKNQNYTIRISYYLTIVTLALAITASAAFAQGGAKVYLQPLDSAEGTITVDVMAENVTDMYGAEFQLKYDPAMLVVQDAAPEKDGIQIEGGTLLPADKGFVVANKVDEAEGTIIFALTLLNPAPPVTGSGPLARVTFNVINAGPATIDVARAKLVAIDLQTIPSSTTPLTIDNQGKTVIQPESQTQSVSQPEGQVVDQQQATTLIPINEQAPQVAANDEFPWWIVAAGVLILGILGLIAFIAMTGLTRPKKSDSEQQTPQRQQAQVKPIESQQPERTVQPLPQRSNQTARTRPSAFK